MTQTEPGQNPVRDSGRTSAGAQEDVVALLMRQHGDIRNLFDEVEQAEGDARREAFGRLVRLLAVHETAEEEIVHPYARRATAGGEGVVADRLEEERQAKEMLARLDGMDTDDPAFLPQLLELRTAVMEHARAEERYEFTHLRRAAEPGKLAALAKAVRAAETTAPTHPHPGVESAAANLAAGPLAAVMDRARDAARRAMKSGS
ncbi:hemerythrin domain-containing protein [Streptomyces aidingensis]|uniref:Hemerythrin HHE cation binding domain-containing protein n=1 Tax=Streptomyces aidingensis TaxID=910347 RepID=A0A1I1II71_9ACTN|nr:hemerythrin domain-containing protein [Streptomyces aidingensis]SFC35885.1 Hemerythrin HHE cation binding domain-containing protein [Streptomyces aidingensis]